MSRTIEIELFASISADEPLGGVIAVGTDGTHDADGAVRLGVALARRDGVAVALLSVIEPKVVRSARCAVLVAPARPAAAEERSPS